MLVASLLLLIYLPSGVDKVAEEALDNNQAMLESIVTFHSIAEGYTQSAEGKFILTSKSEQWKRNQVSKTEELFTPLQGPSRKSIALTLDGLDHILYLPSYPPAARAQKMGHMLMPGSIYWKLGYCLSDDPNKRSLSPSEMLQAGYRVVSSKVEGKAGERNITLTFNHDCSIVISERYNYLVTNRTESTKGYSWIAQASDIREVATGIYAPFKISIEERKNDIVSQRTETRVKFLEINKPIDPARFKLNMEPGGTMTDFTRGKAFFVDPEGVVIKENPDIKFAIPIQKPSTPITLKSPVHVPSNNYWRISGIVAGCLLLLVGFYILFRNKVVLR